MARSADYIDSTVGMTPFYYYQIYGMTLSASQPLSGLIPLSALPSGVHQVDLHIQFIGHQPLDPPPAHGIKTAFQEGVTVLFWAHGEPTNETVYLRFTQNYSLEFRLDAGATRLDVVWNDPAPPLFDYHAFLLGPILTAVQRLRGRICLHASVCMVNEKAIGIVGRQGAGKSTTAAALAQLGYPLLSDDVAAIELRGSDSDSPTFWLQPGLGYARLTPASMEALALDSSLYPLVFSQEAKRYVSLADTPLPTSAQPLGALYILDSDRSASAIELTPLSHYQALMALLTYRSINHLQEPFARRHQEVHGLSMMAATIPIRQVHRPDSLAALPQLCQAILADCQGILS